MSNKSSDIPKVEVPEFQPSIPDYMVDNIKDESIKFLVEQVSIIKQQNKWQSNHIAEVYDYTREVNGKVIELEQYRQAQEVRQAVQAGIKEKKDKFKKYIIPTACALGVFIYPLYISTFLEVGPVNMADVLSKILP